MEELVKTSMSNTTKALKKQAATAQSVARRTSDTLISGQMTTLALGFRTQADVLKKKRKRKK
jgi:predicted DNA-binding ArsR family transcriptional regulator